MFEELKKKIRDIETQSLAMDGCSPSFSVSDILSIIDSVGKDIDITTIDTISRQAAIDLVKFECGEWTGLAKTIGNRINELPSAQPEKVKCRKCRYVYYDKEFGNYWCNRKPDSFMVEEDGYCKWGK